MTILPDVGMPPGLAQVGAFGQVISMTTTKNISRINVLTVGWSLVGTVYIPTSVKIGDGKSDAVGWVWWVDWHYHKNVQKINVIGKKNTFLMYFSQVSGVNQYECAWTGYVNQYDGYMNYNVPTGRAITGVQAQYNNRDE